MKKGLFLFVMFSICYNSISAIKYNIGLYESTLESVICRISSGLKISKDEISKSWLSFSDNRNEALKLDAKFGQQQDFSKIFNNVLSSKDDMLIHFAKSCQEIFDDDKISQNKKILVHFLLDGVMNRYMKLRNKSQRQKYLDNAINQQFLDSFKWSDIIK